MKFRDNKLILTEQELNYVKQANILSSPYLAGSRLQYLLKNNNLTKDINDTTDLKFFIECIQSYRSKQYEVVDK